MRQKKSGWKRPALLFLVLLLLAQIGDIVYLQYFDTSRRRLPVLMYHHFADEAKEGTVVTPVRFREQMNALKEAGYAVTFTIDERPNYLSVHNGSCLRMMGRVNVTDWISGQELVQLLQPYSN